MDFAALGERKLQILNDAADRWQAITPEVSRTRIRLARGGPQAANSAARLNLFRARQSLKRTLAVVPGDGEEFIRERIFGDPNFEDLPPNAAAQRAGRPVARLVDLLAGNRVGEGFATGFAVGPGLLLTNWHVFAEAAHARGRGAQFGYERGATGLVEPGSVFELDPDAFFLSDKSLDIALVGVVPTAKVGAGALAGFDTVRLIPTLGKILVGHPVNIIQHPDGRHKHWAVRRNMLWAEPKDDDLFLTYTTDTLPGSSGSPSFNFDWELVAVHSTGVPRRVNGQIVTLGGEPYRKGMPDSEIDWIANAGARVSKVYEFLRKHLQTSTMQDAQRALLSALVATMVDPAPVNGTGGSADSVGIEGTPGAGSGPVARRLEGLPAARHQRTPAMIVVHGTANFYFGQTAERSLAASPAVTSDAAPPQWPTPAWPSPVLTEKKLRFDSDYGKRPGYDSKFLDGYDVPMPSAPTGELLKEDGQVLVLRYHHYSLAMHRERRLAMWTATNVNYDPAKRWRDEREDFGDDTWKADPRIPGAAQIEDLEFYQPAAKFDRGHLVRRNDVAWGETMEEEEFGNSDSFHWTNCTPQHEGFNRDMFQYQGLWGELENHIAKQSGFVGNRLIVFAGPVLSDQDPKRDFGSGVRVKVPLRFWKVVVAAERAAAAAPTLRSYGFILDQTDAIDQYGWEARFRVGKFKEQQCALTEISEATRVTFPQALHDADPLAGVPTESARKSLLSLADVQLR